MAEMSSHTAEKFTGIQVVKAFASEDLETQKYQSINEKSYGVGLKKIYWQMLYFVNSQFLPNVGTLIVLWFGGKQIISGADGSLTPG